MTVIKPPPGLRSGGLRVWRAITSGYELADQELVLLTEAARTVDLLESLEAEIQAAGAIVESPQGRKANPAVVEARQQRLTLARLLAALRIPLDEGQERDRTQRRPVRGVYGVKGA